jgi:dUTP pyrophosphatase
MLYLIIILALWFYLRYFGPLFITYKRDDASIQKPDRAYHKAACWDIYAKDDITIPSGDWRSIPTGLRFAPWPHIHIPILNWTFLPFGNVAAKMHTRSSHAKKGLRVHLGVLDNDYRGEILAIVYNHNPGYPIRINPGDKIAQIEFYRVPETFLIPVSKLSSSARGEKGFGSSGR